MNVKNAMFDWTRTAMPSSLLLSPEGFRVEPYKLKESCKEAPYIVYGLFASLRHARLTAIKSAFGLDIIQSTPLCQNKFGPRKSNLHPLLFSKNPYTLSLFYKQRIKFPTRLKSQIFNSRCLRVLLNFQKKLRIVA